MARIDANDESFILNTALARKRVRVVQLLIVGLLGLLIGLLGSFYVQSSCHLVSAYMEVGEYSNQVFDLHYGLWRYSPMDSAFQGYSYCYLYSNNVASDAPYFPRYVTLTALFAGAFALGVLWYYLIFGRAIQIYWRVAVGISAYAGVAQLGSLFMFSGDVCQRNNCTMGPAGFLSIISSIVWFILSFEMQYNMPMSACMADIASPKHQGPGVLVATLEMSDFQDGAKAYVRRITRGEVEDRKVPSLNQIQRDNANPIGEAMLERDIFSIQNKGSYQPPFMLV